MRTIPYANITRIAALIVATLALWSSAPGLSLSAQDKLLGAVQFQDEEIGKVFRWLADQGGFNLVVADGISKKVTIYIKDVSARAALRSIAEGNDLLVEEREGVVHVRNRESGGGGGLKSVVPQRDGSLAVDFENVEVRAAVMEIARIGSIDVSFATDIEIRDNIRRADAAPTPSGQSGSATEAAQREEQLVQARTQRRISYHRKQVQAWKAIADLCEVADLELTPNLSKLDAYDGSPLIIRVKPIQRELMEMDERSWSDLPEPHLKEIADAIKPMLTELGRVTTASNLQTLWVRDTTASIARVETYVSDVKRRIKAAEERAEAEAEAKQRLVKVYSTYRNVGVDNFAAGISQVLSADGKATVNADNNTVIVVDAAENFPNIDAFMRAYDAVPQQVQINASIAEVTLQENESHGMDVLLDLSASHANHGTIGADTRGGLGAFGLPTGATPTALTFTNRQITTALSFLRAMNRVNNLSSPTTVIAEGGTARIVVGEEVPFLESASAAAGSAVGTVSFKDVAIEMEVTPSMLPGGLIRLAIKVAVKEQIDSVTIQGNATPVLSNREITSTIFVRDGETLAIGGLLSKREREQKRSIPILGDLPGIGMLFQGHSVAQINADLMFFVTPTLVGAQREQYVQTEGELRPILLRETRPVLRNADRYLRLIPGAKSSDVIGGDNVQRPRDFREKEGEEKPAPPRR